MGRIDRVDIITVKFELYLILGDFLIQNFEFLRVFAVKRLPNLMKFKLDEIKLLPKRSRRVERRGEVGF